MSSSVAVHPSPPRRAEISLDVVQANARALMTQTTTPVIADLRGNAYGHGAIEIAAALDDGPIGALLVSSDDVARAIRDSGVSTPAILRSELPVDASVVLGPELFGLDSVDVPDPRSLGALPAMTLSARVLAVKKVGAGEGVSYGYVYRTPRATTLAMVCLGYSDGIDRHACDGGRAWFAGSTHPIAGRVAMDVFMLDVGDSPVTPGDEVVLFGDEARGYPSPLVWAARLGKTAAEVAAALGDRIVRSYP